MSPSISAIDSVAIAKSACPFKTISATCLGLPCKSESRTLGNFCAKACMTVGNE